MLERPRSASEDLRSKTGWLWSAVGWLCALGHSSGRLAGIIARVTNPSARILAGR
jgi:hypothetical protein